MDRVIEVLKRDAERARDYSKSHRIEGEKLQEQALSELAVAEKQKTYADEVDAAIVALGGTIDQPAEPAGEAHEPATQNEEHPADPSHFIEIQSHEEHEVAA